MSGGRPGGRPAGLRVAVVGGGLGGLASALFLRRAGLSATVYEQAPVLREVGAGIVVTPNVVRLLRRIGLAPALAEVAVRLEVGWEFRRWADGRVLFAQEMGEECVRRYGEPCYVVHRADLLRVLQQALPGDDLRLDHRCVRIDERIDEVAVRFVDSRGTPSTVSADVVVGADGIHSTVRTAVAGPDAPEFSGLSAYRCLVPVERAPEIARRPVQTLWLGPGRHFVHYPVSVGRLINVVAFVPAGDWRVESWSARGSLTEFAAEFAGWDERPHQLITAATETSRWAIYDRAPLAVWTTRRVALLGDAGHPMLPFFAQGAGQAVEDAAVLAGCLAAAGPGEVAAALRRYQHVRQARAASVQRLSRGRQEHNHLPDGPAQRARDAAFASEDPLGHNAWLYGYDAEAALLEPDASPA